MILESNYANDIFEQIDLELERLHELNKIDQTNFRLRKEGDFNWLYQQNTLSFPSNTVGSTNTVRINNLYFQILANHYKENHPDLYKGTIEKTVDYLKEDEIKPDLISTAIYDKVSSLLYKYDSVLAISKESSGLFGIEDEEKILLIHLNKYIQILKDPTKQIEIIYGIDLNKKISDLVVSIYVRFIQMRLQLLNPDKPKIENINSTESTKLLWKGKQKDLVELFVELQAKGWLDEFNYGDRSRISKAICNLFDLSETKRSVESDPENSFYQKLKGLHNTITKKREFDKILGTKNDRKFNEIKQNKK